MAQLTIRDTSADLPALEGDTGLDRVRSLGAGSLSGFEFGGARLREVDLKDRGCDLRGNDLSAISGAHHLKNIVLDRVQVLQLAEALVAELGVTFADS